ncbi:unnamed protein product [Victoria cruziana]
MAMYGKKSAYSCQLLSSGSSRIFSFSWGFPFLVQKSFKSSGRRPKKKIYYREHDLDRVMELQKKPSLILQLKNIILNQKNRCILLRDLEKEVGIVEKWNFMSIIERYPLIFKVTGGSRRPYVLQLTDKAFSIAKEEEDVTEMMEPVVVTNLRKLLMMSMDCRIPLAKIVLIQPELGLSKKFMEDLIPKYPSFFRVQEFNGHDYLQLESWDSSLAVTARESNLFMDPVNGKRTQFTKDGNFYGPFSFRIRFPAGFRPNARYLEEFHKWQKLAFPSPYLNARQFNPASPPARKRAVAVLHELLSLTVEKRLTSAQLDAFHAEYQLPCRLLLCLVRNHGIFYLTNKGTRSTVILKEAYDGSCLIDKSPLVRFNDKFLALAGRSEDGLNKRKPLTAEVV